MLVTTAATGYLGSVLVHLLVRSGYEVLAAVRDPARAAALLPAGVDIAVADLHDGEALPRAADGCDAVLRLAGSVGGTPEDILMANVEGTRAVLAATPAAGVPRFVHTGTAAALMDATGLVAWGPVAPPALTNPYSTAKAAAEELVLAAAADGLDARIVSPVSIYGPGPLGPHSYNGLFLAAARGEVPEAVGATVGWVLADDVADGLLLALERGEPGRRTCCAASPRPTVGSCTHSRSHGRTPGADAAARVVAGRGGGHVRAPLRDLRRVPTRPRRRHARPRARIHPRRSRRGAGTHGRLAAGGTGRKRRSRRPPRGSPAAEKLNSEGTSDGADRVGLRALLALARLELDPLVLVEAPEAVRLDGGVVDEDVRTVVVGGDEAETLFGVEPLDGALRHTCSPYT